METKDKTQTVNIPKLNINDLMDIYYEEPENFEKSIHREVYSKAFHITEGIINSTITNFSKDGKNQGTKTRNREQICNIVFFTGDKGTGKTSTMLSYMEFLKDYHRNYNRGKLEQLKLKHGDFMFTGIEHIDASALDDKEDILGSVLSKMLSKWKNEEERSNYDSGIVRGVDYDHKRRELRLKFSEIYDCLKDLRSTKDLIERDTDMFMETIERLSLSWNVKQSFQKLVERYLDIMVYPGSEKSISKENHYLVISIDDLDMNVNYSFMLLEQIRKYLMVPNVLVLMSANYEQLEKNCHNHYLKEFKYMKCNDDYKGYTFKLSREYLEKMIPEQRQVKLASGKRWEYFSESQLCIECKEADKNLEKAIEKPGTICQIVSRYMEYCFGVKFNSNGRCIKYIAPQTIRETCGWISQINSLIENSKEEEGLTEEKYRRIREYWEDEFQRLCKRYMSKKYIDLFSQIEDLELIEQIRAIDIETEQEQNISLVECLIKLNRNGRERRELRSFCIIYYSMQVALSIQEIRYVRKMKEERIKEEILKKEKTMDEKEKEEKEREGKREGKKEELENISKLMSKYYAKNDWGIWGRLERDMCPPLTNITGKNVVQTQIARTKFFSSNKCLDIVLDETVITNNKNEVIHYININKEKLQNYQYLLLFYHLNEQNNDTEIWKPFLKENNEIKLMDGISGVFSLSGFVLNLIEGAPLNKKFRDLFVKSNLLEKFSDEEKIKEWNKISIFRRYDTKKEKYVLKTKIFEEYLIPVDNLEFIVEMGEKLLDVSAYNLNDKIDREAIQKQISIYFESIIKCLKDYDERNGQNYSKRFSEYELVKKIIDKNKSFMDMLVESIMRNKIAIHTEENEWNGSDF